MTRIPLLAAALLLGAAALQAQAPSPTGTWVPTRRDYAHSHTIDESYDRFTDSTTVRLRFAAGNGSTARSGSRLLRALNHVARFAGIGTIAMRLEGVAEGDPPLQAPAAVRLALVFKHIVPEDSTLAPAAPGALQLLTDARERSRYAAPVERVRAESDRELEEERKELAEYNAKHPDEPGELRVTWEDRYSVEIPFDALVRLAGAKRVEGRLAGEAFVFGPQEMEALRDFASRLAPPAAPAETSAATAAPAPAPQR